MDFRLFRNISQLLILIPFRKTGDAPTTPMGLRAPVGGGDHLACILPAFPLWSLIIFLHYGAELIVGGRAATYAGPLARSGGVRTSSEIQRRAGGRRARPLTYAEIANIQIATCEGGTAGPPDNGRRQPAWAQQVTPGRRGAGGAAGAESATHFHNASYCLPPDIATQWRDAKNTICRSRGAATP
ncbi:hypothetical protein EVAR_28100_1 [Eumeta japonica]|uniref:Uncharacterized protein n=1 Tax=Eumeta variegata TaxID=151549 RepID=A0A4C1WC44_EUMVA|nr:hypothetical protein EVAR_28100_1 [Eumeta japonica]